MGLDDNEIAEAGVGVNMIENIGSSFGTAFIATILVMVVHQLGSSVENNLTAYHAGFLVSVIALIIIVIPSLFLTHKRKDLAK